MIQLTRRGIWRACGWIAGLMLAPAVFANVFTVTNTNSVGPGSLAQAAEDARQVQGDALISFAIPGAGPHKIDLRDAVVALRERITLDGYTQPGAKPNSLAVGNDAVILIQLDGGGPASGGNGGLHIIDSHCVIRGLSLTGFTSSRGDRSGVSAGNNFAYLQGWNRIEGNFIGVEPDGVTLNGNDTGIDFSGTENIVGGTTPAARNVISGNRVGVSAAWQVIGNYIGTDASGFRQGYGNNVGISFAQLVGGNEPGAGNVITGNATAISVSSDSTIQGNLIGTYADGTASFGNSFGIRISGTRTIVGGLGPGEGNVIGFNSVGVSIAANASYPRAANSILSNVFPGTRFEMVDLGADGSTPNDAGDGDTGPNNLQNFPIVSSVTRDATSTRVRGGLNSTPSTTFTLQFFATAASAASQELLGTRSATTNSAGDVFFDLTFPTETLPDDFITATATDPNGNTSEFFPPNGDVELANLSTRGSVGAGENVLIAGYILENHGSGGLLIRALGPSLGISGVLSDPQLDIRYADGSPALSNRSWREFREEDIRATGLAPGDDREPAVIFQPSAQAVFGGVHRPITVQVSGENDTTGTATVEIYRLPSLFQSSAPPELQNISTRGRVDDGGNVLIAGTILQGSAAQRVIIRAIGPELAAEGVGAPLTDPVLELYDAEGNLLVANDNWRTDQEQEIIATELAPQDDRSAAIVTDLLPTAYTAVVRGKAGTSGIGIVEIYALD